MLNKQKASLMYISLMVFVLVYTCLIIYTNSVVRFWADDFCHGAIYLQKGFLGGIFHWWNNWSGRYSNIFILHLILPFGESIVRLLPLILFSGLTLSLSSIVATIFKFNNTMNRKSIVLSAFFVILILINSPNIIQSFYWMSGSTIYAFPFIFLNLFLILLLRAVDIKNIELRKYYLSSFVLMFIAGGFSELFAVSSLISLSSLFILYKFINRPGNRPNEKLLLYGIFGLLISLIVMRFSPGLIARNTTLDKPEIFSTFLISTLLGTKWYLMRLVNIKSFQLSIVTLFSTIFLVTNEKNNVLYQVTDKISVLILLFIPTFSIVLITFSVIGASYYSMNYFPPERVMIIVVYFVFIFLSILFYISSDLIKRRFFNYSSYISVLIFIAFVLSIMLLGIDGVKNWQALGEEMDRYAKQWDQQKSLLEKSNSKEVTIEYIEPVGDLDGFIENDGWVAGCAADYYGVEKIKVKN